MRTRLLIALLLPLCSAAPLDKDVDTEDDHVHDGSDNQREGNIFTHNQIGLGDIDVSGGVEGHDVSIGHQLEIDVHEHEHEVYAQEHSGHAHGDNAHTHDHHVQGISTAETNRNIRAIEDLLATIQTIEDELNFSDGRGDAATNNLSGDDRSFKVITQLINFFDESNMFGHEKKLFEIITRAIMHFYRVWHTQFRNPDLQAIMLFYHIWNTQFNNLTDFKSTYDDFKNAGALRSSRSSLQPSFAEIKSKLDAHEQATTTCRTGNCDAEKIEAITKASKFHLNEIKNTGRASSVFQQSFPILKKTVDSVAEKALVAEKAKLAKKSGYVSLGCWKDTSNRAIATLEGSDGRLAGNFQERKNAVELCFEVAKSKGYPAFAVQDGGQCFASSTALETYKKYGAASNCANGKGGGWANDVYKIAGCIVEDGVGIGPGYNAPNGQDLRTSGQLECSSKCYSNPDCVAWTMRVSNNECWLKTVYEGYTFEADDWITGTWECGVTACMKEDNYDYRGNDIENWKTTGQDECANWCGAHKECNAWTLRKSDNWCWIKTSDAGRREDNLFISGTKGCAVQFLIPSPYGNSDATLSKNVHLKYFNKNNRKLATSWDQGGQSISFSGDQVNIQDENTFIKDIKTIFISHGYRSSASVPNECENWVNNYIKSNHDVQVICIDWRNLAFVGNLHAIWHCWGEYNCEAKNSVDVGWWLGRLLHGLVEETGLNVDKVHLAGHSLGAHVAGMMGRVFTELSGKQVSRVTGLDPAGPLFVQNTYGLHKYEIGRDSGAFVDIIHSNGDLNPHFFSWTDPDSDAHFGDLHALGDVDFYPNGGRNQGASGCDISYGACSHGRAVVYYLQSILNGPNAFPSYSCASAETCSEGKTTSEMVANHMGEYAAKPAGEAQKQYYLAVTTDYGPT